MNRKELSHAERLIPDRNFKLPPEAVEVVNLYLTGQISRGRLDEFFDGRADTSLLLIARDSIDSMLKIERIVNN